MLFFFGWYFGWSKRLGVWGKGSRQCSGIHNRAADKRIDSPLGKSYSITVNSAFFTRALLPLLIVVHAAPASTLFHGQNGVAVKARLLLHEPFKEAKRTFRESCAHLSGSRWRFLNQLSNNWTIRSSFCLSLKPLGKKRSTRSE